MQKNDDPLVRQGRHPITFGQPALWRAAWWCHSFRGHDVGNMVPNRYHRHGGGRGRRAAVSAVSGRMDEAGRLRLAVRKAIMRPAQLPRNCCVGDVVPDSFGRSERR